MNRNLIALTSIAIVLGGSFALSIHSVEAKTPRNSAVKAKNYFVPPPPPYTPSLASLALGMPYSQAVIAEANNAVVGKPTYPYSKYITRSQGALPQVVQPNPYVGLDPVVETKVLKRIDDIDSQISSIEKEIGTLLNL